MLSGCALAQAEKPVYALSPVNQYDINLTAAYWNPIMQYVSEKSGVKLKLKIGRTSADTTAYVLAQEVVFPGPEALVAYKFPYAHLLSQDIDVKGVFGGNQNAAEYSAYRQFYQSAPAGLR